MHGEMLRILSQQGGALIPCVANYIMRRNASVNYGEIATNNGFDGRRIAPRW